MALLQWHMIYKLGENELHRPPVMTLNHCFQGMTNYLLHIPIFPNNGISFIIVVMTIYNIYPGTSHSNILLFLFKAVKSLVTWFIPNICTIKTMILYKAALQGNVFQKVFWRAKFFFITQCYLSCLCRVRGRTRVFISWWLETSSWPWKASKPGEYVFFSLLYHFYCLQFASLEIWYFSAGN